MFHQSLPTLKEWSNMVDLDKNELFLYLDPLFIKLSLILMTADNSSYVFMVNKQKDYEYD
jgi:hypothetical protein